MLILNTLERKKEIDKNGEKIIDLTQQVFGFSSNISIVGTGVVSSDLEMRPDLVAKIYYGNVNKMDYILKFNGISNPFSLEAGTVLLIGDETQLDNSFFGTSAANTEEKKEDIRKRFFDPNKLSKKDAKRLELLKKKSQEFANPASNLPPNFAEEGSKEITVKDGMVVFGKDVVANKDDCPVPVSRAKVKAKLLENKIFKNTTR